MEAYRTETVIQQIAFLQFATCRFAPARRWKSSSWVSVTRRTAEAVFSRGKPVRYAAPLKASPRAIGKRTDDRS